MKHKNIIIAIDGYSSTGKSTFAKMIASKLGFLFLDSGAMYRAVTLYALEKGFINKQSEIDEVGLENALDDIKITFQLHSGDGVGSETFLNGVNVEKRIRQLEISSYVSPIATLSFVRKYVDDSLHKYGEEGGVVMDGRDIGTAVFPDAQLKIFMTADADVRAKRRYDELISKGEDANYNEILKNVLERDYIDSSRANDPLCIANDAVILNNNHMTVDEQMVWLDNILQKRWGIKLL